MKIVIGIASLIFGLILFAWLGLQIKPAPFPAFSQSTPALEMETVPLPDDLPAPVARFYREIYGEEIPVIESAVISGRATLRPMGNITFPGRFRFTHITGQDYRHYIELTLFGLPIMKVNERYIDGSALMELPFGEESGPKIDQGANLALWGEAVWMPALWITDPRVRWEPVDDETAILVAPFGEEEEHFILRFDPADGRLHLLEAMRYKGTEDEGKTLWLNEALAWGDVDGHNIPTVGAVTWFDDGAPWAVFTVEEIVYNADVDTYIRAKGP